ncbi:toll/interleukin-1 receptor domain-containing protein [Marinilabilia salmonicolor]|uniref:TIR domain-containing protein n=1 Tax=Marinilabilia salmonicolor TaxID=989 RepID=A0A2T0WJP4_9BACT|nr:TIR domain-containing protein [Marinilabilia salmonicolor]PRY86930.1 TIR domain-containing protein [Marinilabilia salmonicolor]RCW19736.1 TIR domain-containing protein [Marinilabilia salmonicolor]
MVRDEKYKGLDIYYHSNWNNEINGFSFTATVFDSTAKNENDFLFIEKSQISTIAIRMKYSALISDKAENEITEKTIAKVKTRIDFGLFDKGKEYFQCITSENIDEPNVPLEDEQIQDFLLKGLYNVRKSNPQTYIMAEFSPIGFCEILKISFDNYMFNADLLMEDKYIDTKIENGIEEGNLFVTSHGVKRISEKTKKEELKRISSISSSSLSNDEKYDVAISFAGEDRDFAEMIALKLKEKQVNVFYDNYEKADLWGKNLYDYLSSVYSEKSKYCVMLLSKHYENKLWTNLERKSAQARAFRENREYILPIRIDDTKITGIHETIGYIDSKTHHIDEIISMILNKLNKF